MSAGRLRRVDEALRQVIGDVLASELKDPRVGFVTVTEVKASPDLSHAEVLVSVLGSDSEREASLEGLRSAHGFLQRRIASELRLKRTPTLRFRYDETTDRALRIERLLEGDEPGRGASQDATAESTRAPSGQPRPGGKP